MQNPLLERSLAVDAQLQTLWRAQGIPPDIALLAVGGYGRQALYPYSDVDVLLLLPDSNKPKNDPVLRAQLEDFIGACWSAGLEVGSSVRSITECLSEGAKDLTINTALLEARLICGSAQLFAELQTRFALAFDRAGFVRGKLLEMRQRYQKFENTAYALEPNVKESPGGLRDLHTILWLAKATNLGDNWDALVQSGLATEFEALQLQNNTQTLNRIRHTLHSLAQRREDRLLFDLQPQVAKALGYTQSSRRRASEALMRDYYWCAKAVTQLTQIIVLNLEEKLDPGTHQVRYLSPHFNEKAGMIDVVSVDLFIQKPLAILETFLLYTQDSKLKGLSAQTLRALYNARPKMDKAWRQNPQNRALFMQILQQPRGITHVLRLMNDTSVLGRYLWVFRRIVGQMQHDLFHVYTVDQHILMVVRNVRRFFLPEHAHEYPLCSQIAANWDKPWILYIAALFHDIAKGRGGDHSVLGETEVRRFCNAHGVAIEDTERIAFLVREHLRMSHVSQKKDLSDPEVVGDFARSMGNAACLQALYLLTVADIRGTSPKVWNGWKGKLLEDLYYATLRYLGEPQKAENPLATVHERKQEALRILALYALPPTAHQRLWQTLGVSYFMRHDAQEIAWHTRTLFCFWRTHKQNTHNDGKAGKAGQADNGQNRPLDTPPLMVHVSAQVSSSLQGLQVFVYTTDQLDLFARICSFFDRGGFGIVDAKIHTTKEGWALYTFQVQSVESPEHYRNLIALIEHNLVQNIAKQKKLPKPRKGRLSRRVKSFPIAPQVRLHPDERAQNWLLSVSANDRPGLLYAMAVVLAKYQARLLLAKVSTMGERVEDTFLLQGEDLAHAKTQLALETQLLEVLAV